MWPELRVNGQEPLEQRESECTTHSQGHYVLALQDSVALQLFCVYQPQRILRLPGCLLCADGSV